MIMPDDNQKHFTLPYTIDTLNTHLGRLSIEGERTDALPGDQKIYDYAKDRMVQMPISTGHSRGIWRLKEIPGHKIASASYDKTAKLFSIKDESNEGDVLTLKGHRKEVLSLACYDENTLVTGSSDGCLIFWDTANGNQKGVIKEPKRMTRGFYSLVLLDPNTIATGACHRPKKFQGIWNHEIKVWDVSNHKLSYTLEGHTGGISALVPLTDAKSLLSVSGDKTVRIWDLETHKNISVFNGHDDYIYCATSIRGSETIATGGRDRSIKIWDVKTGQSDSLVNQGGLLAHESTIYNLSAFHDHLLISGSRDCQARIWDSRTLSVVRTIDAGGTFIYAVQGLSNGDIATAGADAQGAGSLTVWKFI